MIFNRLHPVFAVVSMGAAMASILGEVSPSLLPSAVEAERFWLAVAAWGVLIPCLAARRRHHPSQESKTPMRFEDTMVSRELRFAIGIEQSTGVPFLTIPVSNSLVSYDEYYALSQEEYASFLSDLTLAMPLVRACRAREADDRLMIKPGRDRGVG